MPWDKNDYLATALIICLIMAGIVFGLYIATQYRAEQGPLKFKENQTKTETSERGIFKIPQHHPNYQGELQKLLICGS